jgi:hypothetical protein
MVVNLKGVSSENPNEYIKTAGTYTLKLTSIAEDGYDKNGDQRLKFTFKSHDQRNHSESFSLTGEYTWRLKRFTEAMKAPEIFSVNDLVGRYVMADVILNKSGYATVSEFKYAIQNDKLEPIPEVKDEAQGLEAEAEELF